MRRERPKGLLFSGSTGPIFDAAQVCKTGQMFRVPISLVHDAAVIRRFGQHSGSIRVSRQTLATTALRTSGALGEFSIGTRSFMTYVSIAPTRWS